MSAKSAWLELEYDNTLGLHKKGLPVFHSFKNGAGAWNISNVTHAWKGLIRPYLLSLGVEKKSKILTKAVGTALILLTLVSTAVVVSNACHAEQNSVTVAAAAHVSQGDHPHSPIATQGLGSGNLFTKICAGIFYLILLFGGRFLLRVFHQSYRDKFIFLKSSLQAYRPLANLNLTLSLPELGIHRI